MRQRTKWTLAAALCLMLAMSVGTASACDEYSGLPLVRGYGYSGTLYGLGYIPVPPYYAIHPPVYYGEQVYRSYGASPFACRCEHVEVSKASPTMVRNRHVVPLEDAQELLKEDRQAAVQPLEILNPYFQSERLVSTDE